MPSHRHSRALGHDRTPRTDRDGTAPKRLLLVRHGQSQWNAERRWQGRADSPLTDAGRAGAAELADRLSTIVARRGGLIWSSPLSRAHETATIVAARLGAAVELDHRLVERDAGPWQGLTTEEIDARWPGDREASRWPDGAEPLDDVRDRAAQALSRIVAEHRHDHPPVVVTHGGLIRVLLRAAEGIDGGIPNLGGSWFEVGDDAFTAGERFALDAAHDALHEVPDGDRDRL